MYTRWRVVSLLAAGALVGLFFGFLLWGRAGPSDSFVRRYPDGARVRVSRVADGDTIILEDGMHVRYRGCDTPETFRFIRDPQSFAEEASERNRDLVEGAWVRLRFPPSGMPALDAHGRLLADVRLDGNGWARTPTIAARLVSEGLAKASSFELERSTAMAMRESEQRAKDAHLGMWTDDAPTNTDRVMASRHGKMYHRESCSYAQRISERNVLYFNSVKAARATDRKPCPTCRPDRHGDKDRASRDPSEQRRTGN